MSNASLHHARGHKRSFGHNMRGRWVVHGWILDVCVLLLFEFTCNFKNWWITFNSLSLSWSLNVFPYFKKLLIDFVSKFDFFGFFGCFVILFWFLDVLLIFFAFWCFVNFLIFGLFFWKLFSMSGWRFVDWMLFQPLLWLIINTKYLQSICELHFYSI